MSQIACRITNPTLVARYQEAERLFLIDAKDVLDSAPDQMSDNLLQLAGAAEDLRDMADALGIPEQAAGWADTAKQYLHEATSGIEEPDQDESEDRG